MPETVVIVNPASAHGRTGRTWAAIQSAITASLGEVQVCKTDAPGEGETMTRQAIRDGARRIVSVGGDGTHHEVLNGFWDGDTCINPDVVLGLLPHGTGSDFAKTLGLPQGLKALEHLKRGKTVAADIGRIQCKTATGETRIRYFLNTCHIGIGGAIGDRVNTRYKHYGKFSFFLATLATLFEYRPQMLIIQVDDTVWEQNTLEIIVANGQIDGGGMHVAPHALINDGLFDFYSIRPLSVLEAILNLHKVYRGELTSRPDLVRYERGIRVKVSGADNILINIDGETAGYLDAELDLLPGAIKIIHADGPGIG